MSPGYEFVGWEALLQVWLPRIAGAVIILIAAWFIGRAVKWAIAKGVDKLPGAHTHNEGLEPRQTVGARLGEVAHWAVLLFGVVAALGVLNLGGAVQPLNSLLTQVAGAVPDIVAAALIFFVGFVVATLARRVTAAALQAANADGWLNRAGVSKSTGATGVSDALGTLVFVLILIPVTIAALEKLDISVITEPAVAVLSTVFDALPRVIAAGIVLAVGVFIGKWVANLIERILPATGFDRSISSLVGLSSMRPTASAQPPAGVDPTYSGDTAATAVDSRPMTPSRVVGYIAMAAIILFTAIEAARLVEFGAFAAILTGIVTLAGQVLVGGVIITVGVLLADVLANLIDRSTRGADRFASTLVRWATIALATAMGLSFMGIADEIVTLAFGLILGSAAVAAALAFGLGGREWAGRMLERWTPERATSSGGGQGRARTPRSRTTGGVEPEPRPFNAAPPADGF